MIHSAHIASLAPAAEVGVREEEVDILPPSTVTMRKFGATRRRSETALNRFVRAGLLCLWLTASIPASDVPAQSRFDSWTIDNGLPQNSVRAILQTRDGYLWFTTLNGLVRYDGVRFTVFDKSNTPGIKSNRFITLFEDAKGSLWIETEQDGLMRYANGTFTAYPESVMALYKQVAPARGSGQVGFWVLNDEVFARWRNKALTPAAAIAGGLFYGLAGIKHLTRKARNRFENVAMISDLFVFVVLLFYFIRAEVLR